MSGHDYTDLFFLEDFDNHKLLEAGESFVPRFLVFAVL